MDAMLGAVGIREAKNRFSELAAQVNAAGEALMVMRNGKPWVTIAPASDAARARRERLDRFRRLTARIEAGEVEEPAWDASVSADKGLLADERVRRYG